MKHRVLYVENDYGAVGGSARALASLIPHLDRDRYEPSATLAAESPSPFRALLRDLDCRALPLGRTPLPRASDTFVARAGASRARQSASAASRRANQFFERDLRLLVPLARLIRREGISLVHANNNLRVNRYVYWAAAACGVPVVAHQRFVFPPSRIDRANARLVRRILCISRLVLDSLEPIADRADLRLVYDGVDVPECAPDPPSFGNAPTIAAVGRLVGWKGQHTLLRAAPALLRAHPQARFLLVGAGDAEGGYEAELRKLVQELGIESQVEFRGHVADMDRLYRESVDIVVHCSVTAEPFGLVMAEAMAAARPLVASDKGASAEIVDHEQTGLLFPAGDPDALAEQLLKLLNQPDWAREMAHRGFERVAQRFDVKRTAREVSAVYDEILAR